MTRVWPPAPADPRAVDVVTAVQELENKRQQGALKRSDFNADLYKRFRDYLDAEFHNKCAYCEAELIAKLKPTIEHYRPILEVRDIGREMVLVGAKVKHPGYWWMAYEWGNLLPSCDPCNSAKSTIFPIEGVRAWERTHPLSRERPLILNPLQPGFVPEEHFSIDEEGRLEGLTAAGRNTIRACNLNRHALTKARKEAIASTRVFAATLAQMLVNQVPDVTMYRAYLAGIKSGTAPFSFAGRWALSEARRVVEREFGFAA